MPVTTTPRQILTGAYAKSKKNQPGQIATESTELLQVVIRAMRGLYAFATRINPTFFADTFDVAYAAPGWARPEGAESIWRIEFQATGAEVVVVPFDDRKAEELLAAVYRFGQIYRPAGNANDPGATDSLTFFYSKRPSDPADLDSPVDALWQEQFNELLILEVAIYLALKDGRQAEADALKEERDRWATLFVAFLEHETIGERRRWAHLRVFNTQVLVAASQLLAGGSDLQLAGTG